jgi:type II secretory pathway pseudopilin PulG
MTRRQRTTRRVAAAFSLIEVLIAVLILAVGILGLGVVIPVIIREQRLGAEASMGVAAAEAAERYIRSRPDINRLTIDETDPFGLGVLVLEREWSPGDGQNPFAWDLRDTIRLDTGELVFVINDAGPAHLRVRVGPAERLWPHPSNAQAGPRFVWDVVFRRLPPDSYDGGNWNQWFANYGYPLMERGAIRPGVQAVVFVRPIDRNIDRRFRRLPAGERLEALLDDIRQGELMPVAVTPGTVRPTLNGEGDYASAFTLSATFNPAPETDVEQRRRIRLTGTADELAVATQPGQKLIDNLGNVYTVTGTLQTDRTTVLVHPPVPAGVQRTGSNRSNALRQVVLTPQIPSAVRVFNLSVSDGSVDPSGSGSQSP